MSARRNPSKPGLPIPCKSWVMNPNGTAIPRPDWRCRCFCGITSEGLTETRIRLQFGRAHRGVLAKRGTLAKNAREELRTEIAAARAYQFSPSMISCVRQLHTTCAAASQSSHNVGLTGEPSAHFKPPIRSSISPVGLPWRPASRAGRRRSPPARAPRGHLRVRNGSWLWFDSLFA